MPGQPSPVDVSFDKAISVLPADTADKLRYELIRLQIAQLQGQLDQVRLQSQKQEERLRVVEDGITKFNTIIYLTMGGGLLGVINLLVTFMRP